MAVDVNQPFDIFIAYHGDTVTGSEKTAYEIYHHLLNNGINAFFHGGADDPESCGDTIKAASNAKLFLFAVNKTVPLDQQGKFDDTKQHDAARVMQEIRAFQAGDSFKSIEQMVSRLFLCPDISKNEYNTYTSLHPIFHGRDCLHKSDYSDVMQWVQEALSSLDNVRQTHKTGSDTALPFSRSSGSEIEFYKKYLKLAHDNTSPKNTDEDN